MKICVIGNSHLASLKVAWDEIGSDFQDVELTLFGSPNRGIARLSVDDEKCGLTCSIPGIRAHLEQTSGGLNWIDYAAYDAFLLYGLFLTVPLLDMRLSSAVVKQALEDSVFNSTACRTARKLNKLGEKPLFCSAEPLTSETRFEKLQAVPDEDKLIDLDTIHDQFSDLLKSQNIRFLRQPPETLGPTFSTLTAYSKNSVRLIGGDAHLKKDIRHMNAEYGRAYLEHAIPKLRHQLV